MACLLGVVFLLSPMKRLQVSGVPLNIFNSVYRSSCLCVIFFIDDLSDFFITS